MRHCIGRKPLPRACPPWCQVDHAVDVDRDGVRLHVRDVSSQVNILAADDLETGDRTTPEITVKANDVCSRAMARLLALEILEAGDQLGDVTP